MTHEPHDDSYHGQRYEGMDTFFKLFLAGLGLLLASLACVGPIRRGIG